jgi:hypothetical protein
MVGSGGRRWALAAATAVAACGGGEFSSQNGAMPGSPASSGSASSASTGGAGGAAVTGPASGSSGTGVIAGAGGSAASPDAAADVAHDASAPVRDAPTNDGNVITKCPPFEVNPATACADGLECTYGTHPRLACRKRYTCSNSQWVLAGMTCPSLGDCNDEQPKPQVGASCPMPEHDCLWSTGIYCRCLASSMGAIWDCYPSPSGCPTTPPNEGQTCDLSAKTCNFGTCPLGTKVTTSCSGAIVHWTAACP